MVNQNEDGTVEFLFFRPAAQSVTLAGDFNDWQTSEHTLSRDDEGWWRIRLTITPGEFRFKYWIDDLWWEADFAAYGVESDKQGGWNSVLWIQAPVQPVTQVTPLRIAA